MLQAGTKAPDFELPDQDGNKVALGDLRGHWVVFWWYPKASTRG
jgi:peroxiredoxin Q/BCP